MSMEERAQRGGEIWEQMLGSDRSAATRKAWRQICPDFEDYVVGFVGGEIWDRPKLDLRTKSLVTITALAALGRTLALELNIRMALRNGATPEDIVEALLQIAPYAGFPAAWEGLAMAQRVFQEEQSENETE